MFAVDDYLYFYSDFLTPERSTAEAVAVVRLLGLDRPMDVLDLACGFGRIANRLALLGHRVTGVEYLPGFLEIARADAARNDLRVDYRQGDMRALDFDGAFDRVLMMFNSFGYFPDDENLLVLQHIARALRPGGRLGFDIAHRDGVMNDFHPDAVMEKGDDLIINRFSFDVQTGRLHNRRIIIRHGQRRDRPFSIRLYAVTELRDLLARAGLLLEAVYAEWDGSELAPDAPAMVAVARKP
jgi:SAM-dependent methyltransferase